MDFTGKRVGLIGTGSTGIQAAPVIAETAAHLTVFQRTANYSVPARNGPLPPTFQRYVKENYGEIQRIMHSTTNGHPFAIEDRSAFDVTPEQRQAFYEAAWEKGGLQFRATFRDLLLDKAANDTAADFIRNKIREIVKDPATAAALADIDHPYAAKRPPIDTDYFETFNRDNVSLVDVRAAPIEAITPSGIRTRDAEYPLDIIVFATGFDAMTGPLLRMDIRGRDGLPLAEAWEAGPRNYLGLQVAGFPNLFTVTGPGSPSVLCNMPVAIEQHVEWITDCIAHMRAQGLERIEPRADGDGRLGGTGQCGSRCHAARAGTPLLVSRRQRARQAARLHALRRRHGALSAHLRRRGCRGVRRLRAQRLSPSCFCNTASEEQSMQPGKRLVGKVALVTGGASGIGAETARMFALHGAKVLLSDSNSSLGKRVAEEIADGGGAAVFASQDVRDEAQWAAIVAQVEKTYGRLDILCNIAGISGRDPKMNIQPTSGPRLAEQTLEHWNHVMTINATGVFLGTKAAIPAMQRADGGSIINISSICGIIGSHANAAYHASKGAVRIFSKAAAIQYAPDKIRVNSVHPGFVDTPMTKPGHANPEIAQKRLDATPLGRFGTPADIAAGCLYLASDEAAWVTGSELVIDGGMTAN